MSTIKFEQQQPNNHVSFSIRNLIESACAPCCGAKIGEQHKDECDVKPYPDCPGQYIVEPALNWRGQLISDIFDTIECDYSGTPPFADAKWANTKDTLCLWCAGTGHPYGDESYGMCECPGIFQDKAAIDLLNGVKGGSL